MMLIIALAALLLAQTSAETFPVLAVSAQSGTTLAQAESEGVALTASLSFEFDGVQTTSDIAGMLSEQVQTEPTRRRTPLGDAIWIGVLERLCLHRCETELPIEVWDSSNNFIFDADVLVGIEHFAPFVLDYESSEPGSPETDFELLDRRRNATVRLEICGMSVNARLSPYRYDTIMTPRLAGRLREIGDCVRHLPWTSAPGAAPHAGEYVFEARIAGSLRHSFAPVGVDEDLSGFRGPDLSIGTRDLQAFDWLINAGGAPEAVRPNRPVDIPSTLLRLEMRASQDSLTVSAIPTQALDRVNHPRPGDEILSVNGVRADNQGVHAMFAQMKRDTRAYEIEVLRDGEQLILHLSED